MQDIIPIEYLHIYNTLPENQKDSLIFSYSKLKSVDHEYLQLIELTGQTISLYREPSIALYYAYARLCFIGAEYERLLTYYEKNPDNLYLYPFVARILTYQNRFEEAIELCQKAIDTIDIENDINLINILAYLESNFSIGLIYVYSRQLDKLNEIIDNLNKLTSKYIIRKMLTDFYYNDSLFFENILLVIKNLVSGQPKQMREQLEFMERWVDSIKDPWFKGYYYNLYGISHFQNQEIKDGEEKLKLAFKYFEEVHDLRGYSTAGANLGTSLLTQGSRIEGRKYIEDVIKSMVELKNYSLAISNILQVSKSYLDEKNDVRAKYFVTWAEELYKKAEITEPATFSYFAYFYSRIGELDKAKLYLNKLEDLSKINSKEESDVYTQLWYYNAASIYSMITGNLFDAESYITTGIDLADKNAHFDLSLELSMILLEIKMKRYIIEQRIEIIQSIITILDDLSPLIGKMDNLYYETIFNIMETYLYMAIQNHDKITEKIDIINTKNKDVNETQQMAEAKLLNHRYDVLYKFSSENKLISNELRNNWFSENNLEIYFVLEALRLLNSLQFIQTNLQRVKDSVKPSFLVILNTGGVSLFTYKFKSADMDIDEVLVSGFLSAISTFAKELFGGGQLSRIDQDNFIILLDQFKSKYIFALIVKEETYQIRKRYKKLREELENLDILEYLDYNVSLDDLMNPAINQINDIIENVFDEKDESDTINKEFEKEDKKGENNKNNELTEETDNLDKSDITVPKPQASKSDITVPKPKDSKSDITIPKPQNASNNIITENKNVVEEKPTIEEKPTKKEEETDNSDKLDDSSKI